MSSDRIEPLNGSPRHYRCDITITLPSGGTIAFHGEGLTMEGMHELLSIVATAMDLVKANDA